MRIVEVVGIYPAASGQNLLHQAARGQEVAPGRIHAARSVRVSIPEPTVFDTHTLIQLPGMSLAMGFSPSILGVFTHGRDLTCCGGLRVRATLVHQARSLL